MEMMSERNIDYFNMKSVHNHHKDDLQSNDRALNTVRYRYKRGVLAPFLVFISFCSLFIMLVVESTV